LEREGEGGAQRWQLGDSLQKDRPHTGSVGHDMTSQQPRKNYRGGGGDYMKQGQERPEGMLTVEHWGRCPQRRVSEEVHGNTTNKIKKRKKSRRAKTCGSCHKNVHKKVGPVSRNRFKVRSKVKTLFSWLESHRRRRGKVREGGSGGCIPRPHHHRHSFHTQGNSESMYTQSSLDPGD